MTETDVERVALYIAVYAERYGRTLPWPIACARCGVPRLAHLHVTYDLLRGAA